ncbi:uncharacterized protein TRAVEDRAFT_31521 [Trametes versicolor FP-101664 SS1]|uniref:uncharacterized protein n=1 Tax=Trametes versicolor (strain FP-101664) TaxID=717944 RepID=UPI0004624594|nr:uncharacterized protein TRAVEDRAFT_31521 [Trametes versicolor FP-101664 SS1]EIW53319.1 hypothetical protein TRAVEDRAFT_31521 [Trametes versicolor FP-101664 SS1]
MGSESEKAPSRLHQKSLGVTNRIWLILVAFVALIVFTRSILPTETSNPRHRLLHTDLKPKNYLNVSDDSNPFPFCPALGPGDELASRYDPIALSQTRFHTGSGARIQRVINKALAGLPVTISIVGGSVSACHGAGDDPLAPSCYPARFFNWWNNVFPHPASELTNGAMRRTSSSYFSFCNAHHIPDITDLVIIELDVDDANTEASMDEFELLVRSIMIRPDSPAVLILGHFSPQVAQTRGFAGADHWHSLVAQFYDVPHISTKPILYPRFMEKPASINKYFTDPVLANAAGHEVIADVLTSYFQTQVCNAWASVMGHSAEAIPSAAAPIYADGQAKQPTDARGLFGGVAQRKGAAAGVVAEDGAAANPAPVLDRDSMGRPPALAAQDPRLRVPTMRINSRPADLEDTPFEEVAPYCVSANDLVNPLPLSMFAGSGWAAYHPPPGSAELSSHAHYFYSSLPTSRFRVNIQVGAGDVGVYYVRESAAQVGEGSAVECWVDDNYPGAVVIENAADVGEPTPSLKMIDHRVARGTHYVECQLLGEEDDRNVPPFKIIGIFST